VGYPARGRGCFTKHGVSRMATDTDGDGADIRLIKAVHDTFRTGQTRFIDATAELGPGLVQPLLT
jgi:hypothetical protein